MSLKKCVSCDMEKPIEDFYKTKNKIHSWCKKCLHENQSKRWIERKIEAMKLFDSKCCKCGYCKNYAALEFHHVDPKQKDSSWTKMRELPWKEIIKELKKCILLCSNCHREEHWPDAVFEKHENKQIKNYLNQEIKPTGSCPKCGTEVYRTKYCSVECSTFSKRKVRRPSKNKLQKLLSENAWVKVAAMYGVSDNAVRKWAKQYKIPTKKK